MKRGDFELKSGAPGGARTHHLLLRRQSLYPNELRVQRSFFPCSMRNPFEPVFARHRKQKRFSPFNITHSRKKTSAAIVKRRKSARERADCLFSSLTCPPSALVRDFRSFFHADLPSVRKSPDPFFNLCEGLMPAESSRDKKDYKKSSAYLPLPLAFYAKS